MNKSATKVAANYMKRLAASDKEEIEWGVGEIDAAQDQLQSVYLVMNARQGGGPPYEGFESIVDGNRKVDEAMDKLQKASGILEEAKRLMQAAARERQASAIKTAIKAITLDAKTKRAINNRFRQEGLGEQRGFDSAQNGYSKAWEILSEFDIVVEDLINSFLFVDRSTPDGKANDGHTTLHLAKKTDDPFTNVPIGNSLLVFTFHRKENGKWGVLCYVS